MQVYVVIYHDEDLDGSMECEVFATQEEAVRFFDERNLEPGHDCGIFSREMEVTVTL